MAGPAAPGWLKLAYPAAMLVAGAVLSPIAIPVLTPERYIQYTKLLHLEQPRFETYQLGPLPQLFADQFGWEEMTATAAGVYNGLPSEIRGKNAIFEQSYGQAGAIDLFGPKYGLPPAISAHQSYFLWGPRNYTGESVIVMQVGSRTSKGTSRMFKGSPMLNMRNPCRMSTLMFTTAAASNNH